MKAQRMLQILAGRYAVMEGPMRRQLDAQTLLNMATHLDEEGARIYLERFVAKWRLDLQEVTTGQNQPEIPSAALAALTARDEVRRSSASTLVRRRPMTELERRVQEELVESAAEVTITVEGIDGQVRAI